jgi:class 3 adenylate cyclase/tetratricopeptide (TPR) repeat protein
MKCPSCQTNLPDEAHFCLKCGRNLKEVKPASTALYDKPRSYTPKFLAEKILSSRSAIEGERKFVTVMFADVAGFTTMSENLDPEEIHRIMDGCFRILMEEVHKVEGTVNEFTGDGLMALFGAPVAYEDHPRRACHAALAIQKALLPYGIKVKEEYGVDFKMRIGLNTGSVVVGAIGDDLRMDYTAQGDTVNLAARMQTNAEPGMVLASASTWQLVRDLFVFESIGKLKVKGREQPVEAYRLKDTVAGPRQRPQRKVYSEMVGRDQELAKLELQIVKAVNGAGSVVNVVGEAGIGKSRLLAELEKHEMVKRVTLLEGRAISMGRNLSFHPVIDLLKNWALIGENDSEAAALNKLETAVRRVCSDETNEVFPFVATMMGMQLFGRHADRVKGIEGESLEKLILKNVRELLVRLTEIIPTVIVTEDLHWADASSLMLLDSLYHLAETQRVVFINVFRPGYWPSDGATVENLKERLPHLPVVEIPVQPLDQHNSEALIHNMPNIKGLHHSVKGQIIERAGGNPFFIEEVVRSLIDEGAVRVGDNGFEVTDKIQSVVIPRTINDVLMARIDRLDEESRNVVKIASVIGRSFFYRILADVASHVEGLEDRLAYLKQIQFIRERVRMDELEYLFKHALAQEAAYESTLLEQRKQIHLKVAESIERIFRDRLHEFYGILVVHYSRGDNPEKAEEFMVKAGEEALRSSASSEALNFFQEGLQLYMEKHGQAADPEKLASFEKNIALAYFNKGRFRNAVHYFDKVFLRRGRRLPTSQASIMAKLAYDVLIIMLRLYLPSVRPKRIPDQRTNEFFDLAMKKDMALVPTNPRRCFAEMIGELRESFNYDLAKLNVAAVLHLGLSALFSMNGFIRMGDLLLRHSTHLADEKKTLDLVVSTLMTTIHRYIAGQWSEIPEYDKSLFETGAKNGLFSYVAPYSYWQGCLKTYQGKFNAAWALQHNLVLLYEKYRWGAASRHALATELLVVSRDLHQAAVEANNTISLSVAEGADPFELQAVGWRAVIQILIKDIKGAQDSLMHAEQVRRKQAFWPPWFLSSSLLGQFMLDLQLLEDSVGGDSRSLISECSEAALKSGKQAVSASVKFAALRTWNYRLMGEYFWLMGKQKKALQWFDRSIEEGVRLGALPDLSRTYMSLGRRLLEPQSRHGGLRGVSAKDYLQKAEAMFRQMDLQGERERC